MADIIDLRKLVVGQSVSGLILITSHGKKEPDDVSKAPLKGEAHYKGKTMSFKVWDKPIQSLFNNNNLTEAVVQADILVDAYRDKVEFNIKGMNFIGTEVPMHHFYKSTDIDGNYLKFMNFLESNLSKPYQEAYHTILNTLRIEKRFKEEWAGAKNHDAQFGGLVIHTYKMLCLTRTMIENDARMAQYSDLLYLSVALHDIGKVLEMRNGKYTKNSFITHRSMGVEIVALCRNAVTALIGEDAYYRILSVIQGHHGEYGDKPTTVWAQLVHLIDMVDCYATMFLDKVENGEVKDDGVNKSMYLSDGYLVI